MNKDYLLREYRDGDEPGIFELWQSIHPDDPASRDEWMKYWNWLYKDNPAGEGLILIVEHEEKIICHHAIIPISMKIGSEKVLGSWGVDAMTHPGYRRQGIWENVIKEIWIRAADRGIDITPGFPNRYSLPGLTRKLQWFEIATTSLAFRPVDWKKTVSIKIKNGLVLGLSSFFTGSIYAIFGIGRHHSVKLEDVSVRSITSFDDRFSGLWENVSDQYLITTARDPDYLNWRYSRPDAKYTIMAAEKKDEIKGYVVLRDRSFNGVRVSYIVDLIAESPEIMRCLISESLKTCKREDAAGLIFSYIADERYRIPLKKEGFLSSRFLKGGLFCARLNTGRFSQSLLQEPANWLVQPSDADTI